MNLIKNRSRITFLVVASCVALATSACGADPSDGDGDGGSKLSDSALSQVRSDLEALYAGTYGEPPASGPPAEPGKKVWYMSVGQAAGVTAEASQGAEDAAQVLGWDLTVFDGKFDYNNLQSGIRQALAADVDGIVMYAVDCTPVQGALRDAEKAGVPVVAIEGVDCDQSLFDAEVTYEEGDYPTFFGALGAAQATWFFNDSAGTGTVLFLDQDDLAATRLYGEGFTEAVRDCAGCTVVDVPYGALDLGPTLQAKVEQAILKDPGITHIQVTYDAVVTTSIVPALKAAGRLEDVHVLGGEGYSDNAELVRSGAGQAMGVGIPAAWEAYAGLDALNRVFAGAEQVSSGIGVQVFDADHNLPESGGYLAPVDFVAAYERVWTGAS